MDASTLTFPIGALEARRPDGMLEYALHDFHNDLLRLRWSTVIGGKQQSYEQAMKQDVVETKYGSLDAALEANRSAALEHFQSLESGAAQPAA